MVLGRKCMRHSSVICIAAHTPWPRVGHHLLRGSCRCLRRESRQKKAQKNRQRSRVRRFHHLLPDARGDQVGPSVLRINICAVRRCTFSPAPRQTCHYYEQHPCQERRPMIYFVFQYLPLRRLFVSAICAKSVPRFVSVDMRLI
jgi:hypothetical protein